MSNSSGANGCDRSRGLAIAHDAALAGLVTNRLGNGGERQCDFRSTGRLSNPPQARLFYPSKCRNDMTHLQHYPALNPPMLTRAILSATISVAPGKQRIALAYG
jgi:hypothetical protein